MISPLDSKVMDANSEMLGVSVGELMSNAGEALANVVLDLFEGKKILFVCGTGNNGGDGFAAANFIGDADVAIFSEPRTEAALSEYKALEKRPIQFSADILNDYDVIVDCVLGTGVHGEIREPYAGYIDALNGSGKKIVSCDVPSGFGSNGPVVRPDITVTFHDMKEGMNEDICGNIIIADIGIPEEAYLFVNKGDVLRYPVPKKDSHKGQNGRLLIIGGGPYTGAPALAGLGALRAGTDLVRISTPHQSFVPIASASPSFVMDELPGDHLTSGSIDHLIAMSQTADAVLIGPGLGTDPETQEAVRLFAERCERPMVIDADGITAIAGHIPKKNIVFTPHHSEFKRLAGDSDIAEAASENQCIILLKGPVDEISDGKRTRKNATGTPAMTVGGTGDVLAGTVAGLLSKGMSPFDSACLGAYLCGKAGERSFNEFSYGLTATDVADNIARVLNDEL